MDDRTLLEKAAKAAGYDVVWNPFWECFQHKNPPRDAFGRSRYPWTPLHDDGDTLRLAVALNINIYPNSAIDCDAVTAEANAWYSATEMHGNDKNAATRRAVVIAAAAMADKEGG